MGNDHGTLSLANDNHVIMVDDNDADVYMVKHGFERARVPNPWLSFPNGSDFLDYLLEVKAGHAPMPALVLLDINLPGVSGFAVLEQIREDPYFAALPVVWMMTSSSDPRDVERAHSLRTSGFVTKTSDPAQYERLFASLL